ncbi:MAG: hypothetical protein LHV69_10155 [Elusimicrobia bacterium]|nr:hypothetical protein [Candidatus Obscuribacterium magneticum]
MYKMIHLKVIRFIFGESILIGMCAFSMAHQTPNPEGRERIGQSLQPLEILESGLANKTNAPLPIYYLVDGEYEKALDSLSPEVNGKFPWLKSYLEGLVCVSTSLKSIESEHFILMAPPDQIFLADYALPVMEKVSAKMEDIFQIRPKGKIRIEIYPTKEDFSCASTLSTETLKRSGAIGICKFHRLMILSPQGLPLGYRWLDSLAHEYIHLLVNELSWTHAELWLHEGTAKYFETAYRANPPEYLTPDQKTKLLEAVKADTLISFARMSPSMVFLKNQDEVSLAFSEVSYAIGNRIEEKGPKIFVEFLKKLRDTSFKQTFLKVYEMSPDDFEGYWTSKLGTEKWEPTKGSISDRILFEKVDEESLIGSDTQGKIRLGDRMRMKGLIKAALIEYESALKEEPDNAVILLKIARTDLLLNEPNLAETSLKKAIQSNPNYGTPYIELAKLTTAGEAIPLLLSANAINPFDPQIHFLLGRAYETLGELDRARKEQQIWVELGGREQPMEQPRP